MSEIVSPRSMLSNGSDQAGYEILRSIRKIVRKIYEHSKALSKQAGLTVPQLMCIKAIGELEERGVSEITVAQVGKEVHLSPATVSRIVDRLERAGLVLRERKSRDRRKVCLSLTAAGFERFQTLPTPLHERVLERLQDMPAAERRELLQALGVLTRLMEAEDVDASPLLVPGVDVKSDIFDFGA